MLLGTVWALTTIGSNCSSAVAQVLGPLIQISDSVAYVGQLWKRPCSRPLRRYELIAESALWLSLVWIMQPKVIQICLHRWIVGYFPVLLLLLLLLPASCIEWMLLLYNIRCLIWLYCLRYFWNISNGSKRIRRSFLLYFNLAYLLLYLRSLRRFLYHLYCYSFSTVRMTGLRPLSGKTFGFIIGNVFIKTHYLF